MPVVPQLGIEQVQQTSGNIKRSNIRGPQFDERVAEKSVRKGQQAVNSLVQTAVKIESDELKRVNDLANIDNDKKMAAIETAMLFDPESGAMNQKGKNSFGLPDSVLPEFDKAIEEMSAGAANRDQQDYIKKRSSQRRSHINNQLYRHMSREGTKYDAQVTESYLENEQNAAIENFHDPERVSVSIERQKEAFKEHAERNGLPSDLSKAKLKQITSDTHTKVTDKLLSSGSHVRADEYFQKHKKDLLPDDVKSLNGSFKESRQKHDSQQLADKIMGQAKSLDDALAKARKIKDPINRDNTVRRVKQFIQDDRLVRNETSRQNFDAAFEIVEATKSMDQVPPQVIKGLTLSGKKSLEKRVQQLRNGLPEQTDMATYYELEIMASTPQTKDKFLRLNLLEKRHKLSETDFKKLSKLQANGRKGSAGAELDGIETKHNIIKNSLIAGGIDISTKAGDDDIKKSNEFRREIDRIVVEKQEITGKKITNAELRVITEGLMTDVITDEGYFFDTTKKVFELSPEDRPQIKTSDIPPGEISKIESALRSRKIPTSDENITQMYAAKLNKLRGK